MKGKRAALAAVTTLVGAAALIYSGVAPGTPPAPRAALTLPQPPAPAEQVVVGRVVDGDTAVLTDRRRVRVLGLSSCERSTPGGPKATARARELLQGQVVTLRAEPGVDLDHYRRLLRYVALPDGRDFATEMVVGLHSGVYIGGHANSAYIEGLHRADVDRRDCSR